MMSITVSISDTKNIIDGVMQVLMYTVSME